MRSHEVNSSVSSIIEDMAARPLMVAYSAMVNDEVCKNAKEVGFDMVIENPITVDKINNIVISNIELRREKLSSIKNEILNVQVQVARSDSSCQRMRELSLNENSKKSESDPFRMPSISEISQGLIERINELNSFKKN